LYKVHRTPMFMPTTAIHSGKVFDNGGLCGGYPAPTALYHYAVRETNLPDLIAMEAPLPHAEGDPLDPDPKRLVQGEFEFTEGGYIGRPFKDGDLFQHFYNSGGGYGDPLERDPRLVAADLDNGVVTARAAENVYRVATTDRGGVHAVDAERTRAMREAERAARLADSVPVTEWVTRERERVLAREFAPEVRAMYRDSMRLSDRWTSAFAEFWGLPEGFSL
ncbi:MAG: hypothetical protein JO168_07055, partial [Solirubrobacterales bacterium]|nr:hypothetical protein [Solirubrobacterales bacterium]